MSDEEFPLIRTPDDLVEFINKKSSLRNKIEVVIASRSFQNDDWLKINDLYKRVTGRQRPNRNTCGSGEGSCRSRLYLFD